MPTQTQTQQQNLGHRILILDDYQHVALKLADWSPLSHIPITVLNEAIPPQDLVKTLKPFTIIHAMRERTKFTPDLLIQLPNLKFITTTGSLNRGSFSLYPVTVTRRSHFISFTSYLCMWGWQLDR